MIQLVVNESEYKGGMFPKIPVCIPGQDTLLIGADGIPCLVNDNLTTRDIRKRNYNKLVRISKALFALDIALKATSRNAPYQFDVIVSVDCRVSDSVLYFLAQSTHDIETELNIALSRLITQEAKKYELTNDEVSEKLLSRLQEKKQYFLESLGITYSVVLVDAKPDVDAEQNFIKKLTDHRLNIMLEQNKIAETGKLVSRKMEDAIIGQVAEGKIDMKTALEELNKLNRTEGYNRIEDAERIIAFISKLQKDNIISDEEMERRTNEFLRTFLSNLPSVNNLEDRGKSRIEEKTSESDNMLDELLSEEEQF